MDGLALSRIVSQEFPQMKIIIISGYDDFEYASGSTAETICRNLNDANYCGYNDWEIPTLAERTLMKSFANDLSLKTGERYAKKCETCGGDGWFSAYESCTYKNVGQNYCGGSGIKSGRVRLVRKNAKQ